MIPEAEVERDVQIVKRGKGFFNLIASAIFGQIAAVEDKINSVFADPYT